MPALFPGLSKGTLNLTSLAELVMRHRVYHGTMEVHTYWPLNSLLLNLEATRFFSESSPSLYSGFNHKISLVMNDVWNMK
jgi:hypothetical protein